VKRARDDHQDPSASEFSLRRGLINLISVLNGETDVCLDERKIEKWKEKGRDRVTEMDIYSLTSSFLLKTMSDLHLKSLNAIHSFLTKLTEGLTVRRVQLIESTLRLFGL
jgi:hypothetical protein